MEFRERLLEVVRGQCNTDPAKLKDSISDNFNGAFTAIHFRCDTSIFLHEVGFYGPFKEEFAKYFVHIELFRSPDFSFPLNGEMELISKKRAYQNASKQSIFYVELDGPVKIEGRVWHRIEFMLEGPKTICIEKIESNQTVVHCNTSGMEIHKMNFEFFINDSKQLPVLRFEIDPDEIKGCFDSIYFKRYMLH